MVAKEKLREVLEEFNRLHGSEALALEGDSVIIEREKTR